MGNIPQIGEAYAVLPGALVVDRGAVSKQATKPIGDLMSVSTAKNQVKVMAWGRGNCLPTEREQLVGENNIVPALMMTRRNIILGRGGLMAYRRTIVDGKEEIAEVPMPPEVKDFLQRSQINKYLATAAKNYVFHSAVPTEFIRDKKGRIARIRALECRHVRLEEQDDRGYSRRLYWKGNWSKNAKRTKNKPAQAIPLYNGDRRQRKFATFEMDDLLCFDEYYPKPFWEGSEEWIRLANKIPQFHDSNLAHGYTMRWHIELPKDYFLDAAALEAVDPGSEEYQNIIGTASKKKEEFLRKLNDILQGLENAGKTIVTQYDVDMAVNQHYPGVKITALNYDMKDDALLKLFDASNAANMSAQGVHPTLANIQTQGKLSSGSEIRNAYLMYVAIHTPMAREIMLRWVDIVREANGWPLDIDYGFRDMLITRLDEDKSGTTETNENTPA